MESHLVESDDPIVTMPVRDFSQVSSRSKEVLRKYGLAILGAGASGIKMLTQATSADLSIVGIYDRNPEVIGDFVSGHKIRDEKTLFSLHKSTPVVIASHRFALAASKLMKSGFRNIFLISHVSNLFPTIFTPHSFYDGIVEETQENWDTYCQILGKLVDETSRNTLKNILRYRLTADVAELIEALDGIALK